ncbi:MAG TPA: hypothetical protein VJ983_06670 [candidate division Zixibacteria bacterium]|nr:hypothetical protein [candidate division Zixibacteria bacterium]
MRIGDSRFECQLGGNPGLRSTHAELFYPHVAIVRAVALLTDVGYKERDFHHKTKQG